MKIHEINNQIIRDIEIKYGKREWDSIELTKMCEYFLSPNFNSVVSWDNYTPDNNKPYSIINTDNKEGVHWLGAYTKGKTVYVYDSFA